MLVINYWKPFASSLLLLVAYLSTKFYTLPVSGLYLLVYVVTIAILTNWLSFVTVQNFLHRNKPLDLPKLFNFKVKQFIDSFNNAATIKQLTLDIDKYFIKEWFVYISQDPTFCNESRVVLEEVLTKMVNVQLNVDNKAIIQVVLNLYLKHLKEFRRRRINNLYRYSHLCSGSKKARNYFIHQLTLNLLNHFINWENSLPYQVLVSIISKRVMAYILTLLSNPEFINYYILRSCASESKINELNLNHFNRVRIIQIVEKRETNSVTVDGTEPQTKEVVEISCKKTWKDSIDVPDSISLRGCKTYEQDTPDSISLRETKQPEFDTKISLWYEEGSPENEYEEIPHLATIIAKQLTLSFEPSPMSFGDLLNKILLEDDETDSETSCVNSVQEEELKPETATKELPEIEYFATITAELQSLLEAQNDNSGTVLVEDNDETDSVRSFCKSCAKTATGVIHKTVKTIKKALSRDVAKSDRYDELEKWLFVEANATHCDLYQRLTKLFHERKRNRSYDSPDSFELPQQNNKFRQSNIQFDDFEVKLPITKTLFDILCELLADNKETSLTQEPVIKSILLLFGNYIEETVVTQANYYLRYCCANAKIPSEGKIDTLSMELEEFVTVVWSGIPNSFKCVVGENTVKDVINLFVSSLQIEKINQDIMLQIFEILCMKLMEGSKQLSPMISV